MLKAATADGNLSVPLCIDAQDRETRILNAKLRVLYQGVFAIPANLVISAIVAYVLHDTFPVTILITWYFATLALAGLRMYLHHCFMNALEQGRGGARWRPYFTAGSCAAGTLWGALCLGLPAYGDTNDYVLLTLVAAGMSAGALATIVAHLPAFILYACAFTLPLAAVSVLHAEPHVAANGVLILFYTGVICMAAKKLNLLVTHTVELQIDNETLNTSLGRVRGERDDARTDKWSTLAQLSHELRTPLNAIIGFSETIQTRIFGPIGNSRYEEYVDHICSSSNHLLQLTTEMLQLSQGEAGKLELAESEIHAGRVVKACVSEVSQIAGAANITLNLRIAPDLPLLRADETKFGQIVRNLLSNAIKFTQANGKVVVEVKSASNGGLVFIVRDTGIGMKPEDIALAMAPFGRIANPLKHKTEGAGLGLPICQRLAEIHQAELHIASKINQGTICTVSFPPSRTIARGHSHALHESIEQAMGAA